MLKVLRTENKLKTAENAQQDTVLDYRKNEDILK
jgi:hypothetical protein